MPDVWIKVSADRTDLVQTKIIDDRKCIVIPINDHVEVNGLEIEFNGNEDSDSVKPAVQAEYVQETEEKHAANADFDTRSSAELDSEIPF